jgi:hypothetical protein
MRNCLCVQRVLWLMVLTFAVAGSPLQMLKIVPLAADLSHDGSGDGDGIMPNSTGEGFTIRMRLRCI